MLEPEKTYTIEDFISSSSSTTISYDILSLYEKIDDKDLCMISYNVLNDYRKEILSMCRNVRLDDDYAKYKFKPRLLAYDLYGSTELYFIILFCNNMCSPKEFTKNKIKLIDPDNISSILTQIYQAQEPILTANKNKLGI